MKTEELSVEEAALAWAQGKRVEAAPIGIGGWRKMAFIGEDAESNEVFNARVFYRDFKFRLAPEPPAKRYRPWTPEEVPVGAVMRWKTTPTHASLICSHGELCVFPAGATQGTSFQDALTHWVYSIDPVGTPDSKRTWLPCGVEVSE